MIGVFKVNKIATLGGVTPQSEKSKLEIVDNEWNVINVDENEISKFQEFNIQYVDEDIVDGLKAPQKEGAYNEDAYKVEGYGDKLRVEINPGQKFTHTETGKEVEVTSPDDMDDKSQKNFSAEDVKPYKIAKGKLNKLESKNIIRDKFQSKFKDIEDDITDMKILVQMFKYYFAKEWTLREKTSNEKYNKNMKALADKLLNDETKLRIDLENGFNKVLKILKEENEINKFIKEEYKGK